MVSGVVRDELPGTMLLEPTVVDDPYAFYRLLVADAPVWRIPDTPVVIVSSFAAVTEATNRVDDFSSNLRGLLIGPTTVSRACFRSMPGMVPMHWRRQIRPCTLCTARPCFLSSWREAWRRFDTRSKTSPRHISMPR